MIKHIKVNERMNEQKVIKNVIKALKTKKIKIMIQENYDKKESYDNE